MEWQFLTLNLHILRIQSNVNVCVCLIHCFFVIIVYADLFRRFQFMNNVEVYREMQMTSPKNQSENHKTNAAYFAVTTLVFKLSQKKNGVECKHFERKIDNF